MTTLPASARARPNRRERVALGFLRQVHEVLALGYAQLDAGNYQYAEEETITGDLVQEMNRVVERADAPSWMTHLAVAENVAKNTGGRKGKARPRIDIEFLRTGVGARCRFGFEAKRLHRSDSVSVYLGEQGLACFLSGRYLVEEDRAGMLGYVQAGDTAEWASRIAAKLNAGRSVHRIVGDECWIPRTLYQGLEHTFETRHGVERELPLSIFHTLLPFHR
jgi:hypothetical protein